MGATKRRDALGSSDEPRAEAGLPGQRLITTNPGGPAEGVPLGQTSLAQTSAVAPRQAEHASPHRHEVGESTPHSAFAAAPDAADFAVVGRRGEDVGRHKDAPSAVRGAASDVRWRSRYQHAVIAIDLAAGMVGVAVGFMNRFGHAAGSLTPVELVVVASLPLVWLACAAINRAYEQRLLGAGTTEYERVGRSFLHLVALTTFFAYAIKLDLSRSFVLIALPLTLTFSAIGRYAARVWLRRQRQVGQAAVPVLAVGSAMEVARFSDNLRANQHAGLQVVAACLVDITAADIEVAELAERGIAVVGDVDTVREAVAKSGARSVAVVDRQITGERLRWISWQLEGNDADLIVLPGLIEVAGRRLSIQQFGELPLLHVAEPEFTGLRRVLKCGFDRVLAGFALLLLTPVLVMLAVSVRLTSPGPALFLQTRIGKDGRPFRIVKFRSMRSDSEQVLKTIAKQNESDGLLFKIKDDPRVTRVGRVLRRYSLDELPQLLNVLAGSMSLVGPRPPLPTEVSQYGEDVRRRLLVKPGITGLWQISGRSDLSWEESVRLDLRYVENWCLTLDMIVLIKTARAVLRPRGAY